jgi:hypothetical protein
MPRDIVASLFNCSDQTVRLTAKQFALLNIYIAYADWDNTHKKFASTSISNRLVSTVVGFNKDQVSRDKKILEIKGFIDIIKLEGNREKIILRKPKRYFVDMKFKNRKGVSK